MHDTLTEHYRRLLALGADEFPHVAGSLAPHLLRTASLLQQWGNRPALCLAGLYHAVYGTDGIRGSLVALEHRGAIAGIIGSEAESVAYLYGACDRDAFHPRIGTGAPLQFVDRFTLSEYPIQDTALRGFHRLLRYFHQRLQEGAPEEIFGAPREPRTQQFLQRIVEAGRL